MVASKFETFSFHISIAISHIKSHLLHWYSQPLDVVLGLLSDELDPLQYVGDVIDASLLDLQDLSGPVQVKNSIRRLGNQTHKFLGQKAQGGVVPCPLTRGLWS